MIMGDKATKQAARVLGERGEDATAAWYLRQGYRIVERNWRCREGEIDIIAATDDVVVFCEVKSRVHERHAEAAAAVDHRKQAKIRRAALRWLATQPWQARLRFDVAVVVSGRIRIFEDAF